MILVLYLVSSSQLLLRLNSLDLPLLTVDIVVFLISRPLCGDGRFWSWIRGLQSRSWMLLFFLPRCYIHVSRWYVISSWDYDVTVCWIVHATWYYFTSLLIVIIQVRAELTVFVLVLAEAVSVRIHCLVPISVNDKVLNIGVCHKLEVRLELIARRWDFINALETYYLIVFHYCL